MSDNLQTTNDVPTTEVPAFTVADLIALAKAGKLAPEAAAALLKGLAPEAQSGPIQFDQWGKVKVSGTEVSIAGALGLLELEHVTGTPLSLLLDEHIRDYVDAATSTTSLKDTPPTKSNGEVIELRGDTRMFKGLAMGGSLSAADKTAARIRKNAANVRKAMQAAADNAALVAELNATTEPSTSA